MELRTNQPTTSSDWPEPAPSVQGVARERWYLLQASIPWSGRTIEWRHAYLGAYRAASQPICRARHYVPALVSNRAGTRDPPQKRGTRIYTVVGTAAALFLLISKYGFTNVLVTDRIVLDPSRVAAQIVTGIGFIGAGLIFVRGGPSRRAYNRRHGLARYGDRHGLWCRSSAAGGRCHCRVFYRRAGFSSSLTCSSRHAYSCRTERGYKA